PGGSTSFCRKARRRSMTSARPAIEVSSRSQTGHPAASMIWSNVFSAWKGIAIDYFKGKRVYAIGFIALSAAQCAKAASRQGFPRVSTDSVDNSVDKPRVRLDLTGFAVDWAILAQYRII